MNCGIYFIRNIINGKIYIGSSCDFKKRKRNHFNYLRKNTHHNRHLQNAFNKYGEDNFIFEIKELCLETDLLELENYYFRQFSPQYNMAKYAESPMKGRKHSEETKRNYSIKRKGLKVNLGRKATDEQKRIRSETRKNFRWTQETKDKMSATAKRINSINRVDFTKRQKKVIDSEGNIFSSMTDCSKFWDISIATVCDILKGRHSKTRKGISFRYA